MRPTSWMMPVNMRPRPARRRGRHRRHRRQPQIRPDRAAVAELQLHALPELRDLRQFYQRPRRRPEQARRQIDDELVDQPRRAAAHRQGARPPRPRSRSPRARPAGAASLPDQVRPRARAPRVSTRTPRRSSSARRARVVAGGEHQRRTFARRTCAPAAAPAARCRAAPAAAGACAPSRRTLSAGSSASTVPLPLSTTELRARNRCTSARAAATGDPAARAVGQRGAAVQAGSRA